MRQYPLPVPENVKQSGGSAKISSKNQVTIPVAALREAGLSAGDRVRVEARDGRIVMSAVESVVDRLAGSISSGGDLRRELEREREGWE